MFLKKIDGPRTVTLPDGSILSRADLPAPTTRRWVASRKATVVRAVIHGLVPRDTALQLYALSDEELDSWIAAEGRAGVAGLKATVVRPSCERVAEK